jgi:hypothetical protein
VLADFLLVQIRRQRDQLRHLRVILHHISSFVLPPSIIFSDLFECWQSRTDAIPENAKARCGRSVEKSTIEWGRSVKGSVEGEGEGGGEMEMSLKEGEEGLTGVASGIPGEDPTGCQGKREKTSLSEATSERGRVS